MTLRTARDVDIMMLYIPGRDHNRKLKFNIKCSSAIYKQNVLISLE